jgi:hypothetical protein
MSGSRHTGQNSSPREIVNNQIRARSSLYPQEQTFASQARQVRKVPSEKITEEAAVPAQWDTRADRLGHYYFLEMINIEQLQ